MISKISHVKRDEYIILLNWDLKHKTNEETKQKQNHSYGEYDSGCQRGKGLGVGELGQEEQISNYKIIHGDVMYNVVTIHHNNIAWHT